MLLLLAACQRTKKTEIAFYHWRTQLQLNAAEQQYLKQLDAKRLYVKFFDVDWNFNRAAAIPLASAQIKESGLGDLEIIPTIFITNRTFTHLSTDSIPALADRIYQRIFQLCPDHFRIQEIQLDCDWTQSTKSAYFQLLKALEQSLTPKQIDLSVTIRLHQIKYFERTGVPPVKRGMLMFYNMGDLERWEEPNSILNLEIGNSYLDRLGEYPLPLDLALPLFEWGVAFRGEQFIKLINNLRAEDLERNPSVVKIAPKRYILNKSAYINGYYLYKGDRLRLENCEMQQLKKAATVLAKKRSFAQQRVTFYHLDSILIKQFPYVELEKIRSEFH